MAEVRQVSPEEAQALLSEGYRYLDVRSEREFAEGHPAGAFNVPVNIAGPGGPMPNPDFVGVVERALGKSKLVVGCKSGPRTRRAVAQLTAAGFTDIAEMPAGWDGTRDTFGRPLPGWSTLKLPSETGTPPGQSYPDLVQKT
jgi:rhodanese-related sulfurtransferase